MTWQMNTYPWLTDLQPEPAAARVIVDNDFAGDPDDFVQLAHHLLSPGAEIRGIIASHLRPIGEMDPTGTAAKARREVERMAEVMGIDLLGKLVTGSEESLPDRRTPVASEAADLVIAEARRDDDRPLFVCCGGGLTDPASALLLAPDIAEKLTVVWIGGPEYPGGGEPVPDNPVEYNLSIDVAAAQAVFDSAAEVWQIPRDVYRQCIVSDAELRTRIKPQGELGAFLYAELARASTWVSGMQGVRREVYVVGDSPLVTVTAMQTVFESTPASSAFTTRPAVQLGDDGYPTGFDGRPVRVFSQADTRLIMEDLVAKLVEFGAWHAAQPKSTDPHLLRDPLTAH